MNYGLDWWLDRPDWRPLEVDLKRPSAARMYDFFLGGAYNFDVDRQRAMEVLQVLPEARTFARQNRAFLRRSVTYCIQQGIRQFLDLGSGLPTTGNVHEVAQAIDPSCRVIYVDNEPVAVSHSQLLLEQNPNAVCIFADITRPEQVLEHEETQRLLDFTQPVAVLMCAVLHFVADERDPGGVVEAYRKMLVSGSFLVLSHATATDYPDRLARVVEIYQRTQNHAHLRTREDVAGLLGGFEHLVWPGVVYTPEWRPEDLADVGNPAESLCYAAVAYRS